MQEQKDFDPNDCKKIISVSGIEIPSKEVQNCLKNFKTFLLNMDKVPNIPKKYDVPEKKLILLNQTYKLEDQSQWPDELKSLISKFTCKVLEYDVEMNFEDLSTHEIFKIYLPSDVMIPAGFETVGSIAHLNLRKKQLEYKYLIGKIILAKNKGIKTVVNKTDKLNNVFRTPELEVIAGDKNLETILREGGCSFKLNFEKVYWNSKLQAERDRLLKTFKPDESLCDMFCGIGPLSIRAAKLGMRVYANDLNPECLDYLKSNSELNKTDHLISCFNLDAREFVRQIISDENYDYHFDHVYMNLPVDAIEFLDVFNGIFSLSPKKIWTDKNLPKIHVCGFDNGKDDTEVKINFTQRIQKAISKFNPQSFICIHPIKDITHEKKMFCVSFKLEPDVAFKEENDELTSENQNLKKLKTE